MPRRHWPRDSAVAEPNENELWRAVEQTVHNVLLPSITDDWPRVAAIQLIGLARYAATRPEDRTPARTAELAHALDGLAGNPIVAENWRGEDRTVAVVMRVAGDVLAAAIDRTDDEADEIRRVLRPIVLRHLDDDLAVTEPMLPYFRGQLPDA
jgi:hypothetical protein